MAIDETLRLYPPAHVISRTAIGDDDVHELAHVELCHPPSRVDVSVTGVPLLSDYSDEQEQEADWYGATLLLPRQGLVQLRSKHKTTAEIAANYGLSEAFCEWRIRMTGVDLQLKRARVR
jgi:hypothetical protein